tara:strand:+ start:2822 stop:3172 length:351 start_codon:yes stop_codon:yes gene_type:complete
MRKEAADAFKEKYRRFEETEPLDFMTPELVKESEEMLDYLQEYLEENITDYSLDESHYLLDASEGELLRTLWFSRGMEDTFICITPEGCIKGMDPVMPMGLLAQIAKALEALEQDQ